MHDCVRSAESRSAAPVELDFHERPFVARVADAATQPHDVPHHHLFAREGARGQLFAGP